MHIEKFEADTLDQALKQIKLKLGPDAIILKTITNKGLVGALKKKKIEITAAISENNYRKKASVDRALGEEAKETFYQAPSSHISKMIDNYSGARNESPERSYGKLALNKNLAKLESTGDLDDFLGKKRNVVSTPPRQVLTQTPSENFDFSEYEQKMDLLEKKVFDLGKQLERVQRAEPVGIFQVRTMLQSFGLMESLISTILKKAMFELSPEELEVESNVLEVALREMASNISIDLPLFSRTDREGGSITVLLSQNTSGQTSTAYKLTSIKENSVLIRLSERADSHRLTKKVFNVEEREVSTAAEIVMECRKAMEEGRSVFVDYKTRQEDHEDVKKFLKGLRRSFNNIEVLTCISSTCSENYNRRGLHIYSDLLDGIILTKLDLCLDFGSLLNIHVDFSNLPLKFFTTGETIPEDIESATKERLLNGIFKFDKGR